MSREDEIFIQRTEELNSVFTAKVLGWICSPLTYSGYPRAFIGIEEVKCFDITTTGYFRIWYSSFIHCSINIIERVGPKS